MNEPFLLLDAGNTRLKWAILRDGVLTDHGAVTYSLADSDELFTALDPIDELPERAMLGSVANTEVNLQIVQNLAARDIQVARVQVTALERLVPAYDDITTLGVDRWLAMLGARSLYPGAVCVADCGTALTLDSVDASGVHSGGMIVPGFALMQNALLTRTARINDADTPLPESVFAASTGAAVAAGATYALAAILDRFVAETIKALDDTPIVMVTGGGRERLLRYAQSDVIEVPDLVLLGMASLTHSD